MTWWPGWDSIENAGTWAHFWFWFGMVCFFLLGASEIIAFRYGLRKDNLIIAREAQQAGDAKRENERAEAQRKADVEGLQKQLADADKKVAELEIKQPERRLSLAEKDILIAAMRPYPGQKISIGCITGDIYGKDLAEDFVAVSRAANWDDGGGIGFSQSVFLQDPEGVVVLINQTEADAHKATIGVAALVQTLANLHLIQTAAVTGSVDVSAGTVRLVIGKKLPKPPP
jgi:hypothetical protein